MLTYTFSKREKVMLAALACILVLVAWYMLVFQNVNNQVSSLNSQIATVQDQTTVDSAKLAQMNTMQKAIDDSKAKGLKATALPTYDNVQALMASLNTTLASTNNYSLAFDNLDRSESKLVKRGVTMTFGCNSYADAKTIITAIKQGTYPCTIDSVSMTDNTVKTTSSYSNAGSGSSSAASSSNYGVSMHVTYFEKAS
jgi:cell division protein FtsL